MSCSKHSGHSGCDGQPAVSSGGDAVENILEVQRKSGRRRSASCVCLFLDYWFIISSYCGRHDWKGKRLRLRRWSWERSSIFHRHDESEKRLPKSCLVLLCKYDPVLRWSRDCDNTLYQGLVEMLIPDVLRPIPSEFLNVHACWYIDSPVFTSSFPSCGPTVGWLGPPWLTTPQTAHNTTAHSASCVLK